MSTTICLFDQAASARVVSYFGSFFVGGMITGRPAPRFPRFEDLPEAALPAVSLVFWASPAVAILRLGSRPFRAARMAHPRLGTTSSGRSELHGPRASSKLPDGASAESQTTDLPAGNARACVGETFAVRPRASTAEAHTGRWVACELRGLRSGYLFIDRLPQTS